MATGPCPAFLLAAALLAAAAALPGRAQDDDAGPVSRIVIEGRKPSAPDLRASASVLSAAPLSETPLSASVIGADQLQDRGVNSLSSAIRDEPSVGDNYNTFGYVENIQVRGFNLNEFLNFRRDGLPVTNHVPVGLENKEAIEILKGVSGVLGGDAAPGGVLNYVLKRPTDTPLRQLSAEYAERGSRHVQGDFGGRWSQERFGYRINLAAEDRHPAVDNAWSRRVFGSGFFDWRVRAGTLVELEFEHQGVQQISVPGYGLLYVPGTSPVTPDGLFGTATGLPPPVDPRINLNAQPWTQPFQSRQTTGSLRLTQQVAAHWELGLRLAAQRSVTNDRLAFPDGCNNFGSLPSLPAVYPGMCQAGGSALMDMYQYVSDGERRNMQVLDAYLRGGLATGAVDHELRLGLRSTRYDERYPPFQTYNFAGIVDILAPAALPATAPGGTANTDLDLHLSELSAFDVLRFGRGWSVWLALRASRLSQASHLDASDGATTGDPFEPVSMTQSFLTPFASLGYAPWAGGFAYASGGEGVEVEQVPNRPAQFSNPGQALPALRSRQIEIGFKQTGTHGQAFSAALFEIQKPFSDDLVDGSGLAQRIGGARRARHRGLELSGSWLAARAWRLEARATWLDAVTTASLDPSRVGHATTNVPRLSAVLRAAWQPPALRDLTISNQFAYSGPKAVLPDGSVDLPGAWQWDVALQYRRVAAASTWTWRAGVDNLADRVYWREAPTAPWGAQYLFPAAPRTVRASVEVRF
jgi:iron complex outermembrane recepter protein